MVWYFDLFDLFDQLVHIFLALAPVVPPFGSFLKCPVALASYSVNLFQNLLYQGLPQDTPRYTYSRHRHSKIDEIRPPEPPQHHQL